jgi:hypothetical protein
LSARPAAPLSRSDRVDVGITDEPQDARAGACDREPHDERGCTGIELRVYEGDVRLTRREHLSRARRRIGGAGHAEAVAQQHRFEPAVGARVAVGDDDLEALVHDALTQDPLASRVHACSVRRVGAV